MTHPSSQPPAPSEQARARGQRAAELVDGDLRNGELLEVEQLLAATDERALQSSADSARVAQLEARVRELEDYLRAIKESTPWRIIQRARRLVGRSW